MERNAKAMTVKNSVEVFGGCHCHVGANRSTCQKAGRSSSNLFILALAEGAAFSAFLPPSASIHRTFSSGLHRREGSEMHSVRRGNDKVLVSGVRQSQASSSGTCCWPLSLIRCGGPSATRTRAAVKRALSFALMPVRKRAYSKGRGGKDAEAANQSE